MEPVEQEEMRVYDARGGEHRELTISKSVSPETETQRISSFSPEVAKKVQKIVLPDTFENGRPSYRPARKQMFMHDLDGMDGE